ncbi:phage protein [Streptococcus pyogenes]|nr:phage protein [Streptococcus pyogenes]
MNIEEAKELVDNSKFYGKTSSVIKAEVRDIIDQLNQPKPEVPQCVADWIEECREEDLTLSLAYDVDAFGEMAKWRNGFMTLMIAQTLTYLPKHG